MRLGATKTGATTTYNGLGDQLYDLGGARPTLDLNFASNGSLVDSVTGKTLVTHTRQSNATYVDGDGIIKDAVTNLLLHSEPDTALTGWTIGFSTGTFSHTIIDSPFAVGERAVKHVQSVSGRSFLAQSINVNANTTYTASFYVDKTQSQITSGDIVILAVSNITGGTVSGDDLLTFSNAVNGKNTITFTTSSGVSQFQIRAGVGVFGNSTGTLVFGNLQLEEASTAGEYVKTTSTINSAPRFDHNPTTGESLGLLVEESRTNLISDSEQFNGWSEQGATVATNSTATTSPDGVNTADLVTEDSLAESLHRIFLANLTVSAVANTFSVFAKRANGSRNLEINCNVLTDARAVFDLENGVVGEVLSGSASIQNVGNGWFRCSVTGTSSGTTSTAFLQLCTGTTSSSSTYDGDGTSGIYIWGAQLEAGSFPTSYIRTAGSTVTRSADVTSIEGNDFGTFNKVPYSEEIEFFSTAAGSVVPNQGIAPDGTFTADKVISTGAGVWENIGGLTSSTVYTTSIYVKYISGNTAFRHGSDSNPANGTAIFELSTGTITFEGADVISSSIEAVGNDWYRCSVTFTATASSTNIINYIGGSLSEFYLWGAQLEESSTATPYVKSDVTFTSRGSTATYYDYNGIIRTAAVDEARNVAFLPDGSGNFVSAGELLLEDAGTNLISYSEEFDDSYWGKVNATIDANAFTAPDGTLTADTLIPATSSGEQRVRRDVTGLSSDTTYTLSVYAKAAGYNFVAINHGNYLVADHLTYFNLNTGTVATNAAGNTASITDVGNGWYRCSVTRTTDSSQTVISSRFYVAETDGVASFTGDGTSGIYVWGAQLEANPYATSYIPTSGSTATRAADVSSSSSNTFGNSFYNQTEGTVFVDAEKPTLANTVVASITDGTSSNRIELRSSAGGTAQVRFEIVESGSVGYTNTFNVDSAYKKLVLAYAENNSRGVANGTLGTEDTSVTIPTVNNLYFGNNLFLTDQRPGRIKRLTYWPTRLSNDTLQTITV